MQNFFVTHLRVISTHVVDKTKGPTSRVSEKADPVVFFFWPKSRNSPGIAAYIQSSNHTQEYFLYQGLYVHIYGMQTEMFHWPNSPVTSSTLQNSTNENLTIYTVKQKKILTSKI